VQGGFVLRDVEALTAGGRASGVVVDGSRIVRLLRGDGREGSGATQVDGRGALCLPGLVNAHDHLEFNSCPPIKFRPRYRHSTEWFADMASHMEHDPRILALRAMPLAARLFAGGLKNLLAGTTTVAHHNDLYPELAAGVAPVRVVREYGYCHSLFLGDPLASYRACGPRRPWLIHLAEGTDEEAARELDRLQELELLQPSTILVHGVGLTEEQRALVVERTAGLVWCPASNAFLLGETARVGELAAFGKLALGSDSRLTGSRDLLAELAVARTAGQLDAGQLFLAVTAQPARMLRLLEGEGELREGGVADLVLFPSPAGALPLAALGHASRSDLELVVLDGRPRLAAPRHAGLFEALDQRYEAVRLDGVEKILDAEIANACRRFALLEPGLDLTA
jgi:cytosine/adenosine deaminase-related metal-dependent hydrolase